jgi:penicillin-binding protein 1A
MTEDMPNEIDRSADSEQLPAAREVLRAPGPYVRQLRDRLRQRLTDGPGRAGAVAIVGAGILLMAFFVFVIVMIVLTPSVDELANSQESQATVVFSADGEQLARFYRQNRTWVPIDSISPTVITALIDTEDHRFYKHWGIDVTRTFGAVLKTAGGNRQGGSTITMQLVRNAYPQVGDDFALKRKLREWLAAIRVEQHLEKDEILEIYLNTVPFNYNAYGIEAAARTYYDVPASRLDTLQAATLVGMLKGTAIYNPVRNPRAAHERRNVVLEQMHEHGHLTEAQLVHLRRLPTKLQFSPLTTETNRAPHFAEHVRQWLRDWAEGKNYDIYADGFRVYTTIDAGLQREAEEGVREVLDGLQAVVDVTWSRRSPPLSSANMSAYQRMQGDVEPFAYYWESNADVLPAFIRNTDRFKALVEGGAGETEALQRLQRDPDFVDSVKTSQTQLQAGFVAIDPNSGQIKAWVGGRNFERNKYDHVAQSKRQPGSTFKPFVYAAAIEKGYSPDDRLQDVKISYVDPQTKKVWEPGNFGGETGRDIALRDGLAQSVNTVTAQLIIDVGADRVAELARRAGIRSDLEAVPSLGLGTSVVTLLEMASAYSTIANGGRYYEPLFITRIEDRDGNVLAEFQPNGEQALEERTAYAVLDMMRGVVDGGTGTRIRGQYGARGDLAAKTGTTQHAADGWFMLAHPELVMGTWVGFPSPAITFRTRYWGQGAHNALHVVGNVFRRLDLSPSARFPAPSGYLRQDGGRLLVMQDQGQGASSLEERADAGVAAADRQLAPGSLQQDRLAEDAGGTRGERLAEDAGGGQRNRGAGDAGSGQRDGGRDSGEQRGNDRAASDERPAPSDDAEALNRQERENSRVRDYLKRLRERDNQ